MSKSSFLALEILDHTLGNAAYTAPATVHVSLHTADPTDAGTGTEVSGGSYAREAVTNNATNWPASTGGSPAAKANGTAIEFVTATASWGTVTHFGIWDAATAGNLLYHGALGTAKAVGSGDTASFAVGDLDISET